VEGFDSLLLAGVEEYRFAPPLACAGKSKLSQRFTALRRTPECFAKAKHSGACIYQGQVKNDREGRSLLGWG